MAYKHGVYTTEQATSLVAPVVATAGLQVVIGTAPVNQASDPYHCTNVPMLANTLAGATAQLVTATTTKTTPSARAWAQVLRS